MRLTQTAALVSLIALVGCGAIRESRLNPLNWFGRSAPVTQTVEYVAPADPRPLVANVLSMAVESYPGGAIVRATGLPPTQGYWDAELVALPVEDDGKLVLEFHIFPPVGKTTAVNQQSREITVAFDITDRKLEGIDLIVVQGAQNARSSRR